MYYSFKIVEKPFRMISQAVSERLHVAPAGRYVRPVVRRKKGDDAGGGGGKGRLGFLFCSPLPLVIFPFILFLLFAFLSFFQFGSFGSTLFVACMNKVRVVGRKDFGPYTITP